jgi:hypothetical protein
MVQFHSGWNVLPLILLLAAVEARDRPEAIRIGFRRGDCHAAAHSEANRADLAASDVAARVEIDKEGLRVLGGLVVAGCGHQSDACPPFGGVRSFRVFAIGRGWDVPAVLALLASGSGARVG